VLADHPAGVALGDPEPIDEHVECSPTTVRGQKFPSACPLSIDCRVELLQRDPVNQASRAGLHQLDALQTARAPPCWRCHLAQPSVTAEDQNPLSPFQRVEHLRDSGFRLPTSHGRIVHSYAPSDSPFCHILALGRTEKNGLLGEPIHKTISILRN
jgi:hypothetical protein